MRVTYNAASLIGQGAPAETPLKSVYRPIVGGDGGDLRTPECSRKGKRAVDRARRKRASWDLSRNHTSSLFEWKMNGTAS